MATEHSSNGSDAPGQRTRPVTGLRLRALPRCSDPAFPVLHDYFEIVYCPLVGATSVYLARALARHVTAAGGPVTICSAELAQELGLRSSHDEPIGKNSPLAKAIDRLAHHRLVEHLETATLGVVMEVPPLSGGALGRLPDSARRDHDCLVGSLDLEMGARVSSVERGD